MGIAQSPLPKLGKSRSSLVPPAGPQEDFESAEFGTSAVRLNGPSKAVVDASGNLWLVDSSNNRVHRWARSGRLWVLDTGLLRVLRFENAAAKPNGTGADGVIGAASPVFGSPGPAFMLRTASIWMPRRISGFPFPTITGL